MNWGRQGRCGSALRWFVAIAVLACAIGPAPATAADPTVVAAGNIACDSKSPYFNAGIGTATRCHQAATGKLLDGASAVLALGDIQYCCGALSAFQASYDPAWGAAKAVTRPVPGTREYSTPQAPGYFDYFNGPGAQTGAAGPTGLGYYSFDLGGWHLVALNTSCTHVSCAKDSEQERWLRADLAAHPASCTLAFGHAPRFSSGKPGGSLQIKPLWQALYEAGADVVLSAHARHYERFAPQKPAGAQDGAYGIRQFVVGTGGYGLGTLNTPKPRTEARQNTAFGVLELTLHPTGYDWRFIPEAGATFSDSGSTACHGPPPPPKPEKPATKKGASERGCTITGTPKNDVLLGTRRRDVICGLGGRDRIAGGKGNDVIYGDGGADILKGGNGADRVFGGGSNDRLAGGRGNDRLSGDGGDDVLRGHSGRDRLDGNRGRDRLFGDAGGDWLYDGADRSKDRIRGGRGRDRARVGANDVVASVERLFRRPSSRVAPQKPIALSER
jgi:hemolysin type calcium-binding protein